MLRGSCLSLLLLAALGCEIDNGVTGKPDGGAEFDSGSDWHPPTDTSEDDDTGDSGIVIDPAPECESLYYPGSALAQDDECFAEAPEVGTFDPVVEWDKQTFSLGTAGSTSCMMQPIVCPLTDDDGDGDIDENDIGDVVIITYSPGVLRALDGTDGSELWAGTNSGIQITGGAACGDIDNDGVVEVIAATSSGVVTYDNEGNELWSTSSCSGAMDGTSDAPAIHDMDADGDPEIIIGSCVLDNTGNVEGKGSSGWGSSSNVGSAGVTADLELDGELEVIAGNAAYDKDGNTVWTNGEQDGYPAIGNFDSDNEGEIVVTGDANMRIMDSDGSVICRAGIPGASASYGGPPTVADFDGDGEAEIGVAANSTYTVFESDCSVLWQYTGTTDPSSGNTGSAVFDFEGDGIADVVYADEHWVWVFDGVDGDVKMQDTYHSNNTWLEYPTIADITGDGSADIAVCNTSGSWGSYQGVTVFGDASASWRPGRRIWNQHGYSITNVNDDGSIPRDEDPNWLTYNNYRSGDLTPGDGYSGPDLTAQIVDVCTVECNAGNITVWVAVGNSGFNDVDDDFDVEIWGEGSSGLSLIHTERWTNTVMAGTLTDALEIELTGVELPINDLFITVDRGNDATNGEIDECHEDNNEAWWGALVCP
ncbi:hypothetical protein LBMAG42_53490 [Deltaproteobacteria bacterium]|nr:hypothetical protein LBMAG42_53490 [Deltaproteobacteria bacterium]